MVHLCVNHPIPATPDIDSTPVSFSPDAPHSSTHTSEGELLSDTEDKSKKNEGAGTLVSVSTLADCYYHAVVMHTRR